MSSIYFDFCVVRRIDTNENVGMFDRSPNFGFAWLDLPYPSSTRLICLTWLWLFVVLCLLALLCLLIFLLWVQWLCFPFSMLMRGKKKVLFLNDIVFLKNVLFNDGGHHLSRGTTDDGIWMRESLVTVWRLCYSLWVNAVISSSHFN